ncbi:MAG: hypothetical protein WCQ90_06025 [Deltaproteobacteria bacterium]
MINRMTMTAGELTHDRKGKDVFYAKRGGEDFQYVIEFDNGSILGYCKITDIQKTIDKAIRDFENTPDISQY